MNESTEASDPRLDNAESILDAIDSPFGEFPEEALLAAREHREVIIPGLIALLERATAVVLAGDGLQTNGQWHALYLLTEFKARQALPAILAAYRTPGDGPFELFGEDVTDITSRVLAELAGDQPEVLDDLIADREVNEYVRWQAVSTYRLLVRDGRLTREQAVARLRPHLRQAVAYQDAAVALPLVIELSEYALPEAMDEIRAAFRLQLVDLSMIRMEHVERDLEQGDDCFAASLLNCPPTGIEDAVGELREIFESTPDEYLEGDGYGYHPEDDESDDDVDDEWAADWKAFHEGLVDDGDAAEEVNPYRIEQIRTEMPRIGRNDACPCGSGKKYKKCCGATRSSA